MKNIKKILYFLCFLNYSCQSFMTDEVQSKKAIVIGASAGMGREVAKRLSRSGYTVGLAARRLPLLESLQRELPAQSYIQQLDVTASDAREKLQSLIDEMGGLDLIVISTSAYLDNRMSTAGNPGCGLSSDPAGYNKQEKWVERSRTLQVCANGFIAMADVAMDVFEAQKYGHLVGISSTSGLRGGAASPEYDAAKACIMTYMDGIRNRMIQQKNYNIYVTDIIPGYVAVEHSPLGQDPTAYCEITCEQAGEEIMAAIVAKKKRAVVPASIWILAFMRKYMPDWVYNNYFPWL